VIDISLDDCEDILAMRLMMDKVKRTQEVNDETRHAHEGPERPMVSACSRCRKLQPVSYFFAWFISKWKKKEC